MPWTISRFPELHTLEPDERAEVLRRVPWWTYPLIGARSAIPALLFGVIGVISAGECLGMGTAGCTVAGVAIGAASAVILYRWQMRGLRSEVRRAISKGFTGRRLPFCFACGYDLRACRADRCPECGRPVSRGVAV